MSDWQQNEQASYDVFSAAKLIRINAETGHWSGIDAQLLQDAKRELEAALALVTMEAA